MKVVEVRYKGNQRYDCNSDRDVLKAQCSRAAPRAIRIRLTVSLRCLCCASLSLRNVFLYEGMSSGEVSKLLSACVAAAAPLGSAGRALPQIVALRDPASGTVIPLSLALKHMPSLWSTVELIDDQQVQQGASGPAINVNASGNSNYKQQAAASNARGARPASASQAALPTPIARNAATNAGGAGRPSTAGYAAQQQARPVQRNNYTQQTQTRQAPMHNFVNSSSPDDSLASSPRFDSRGEGGAASPTFSLASSQGSWNDPASGIHVIMSYGELLNVLTGNQAPNTNNGSTPRAIRQGKEVLYCLGVVRPGSEKCEDIFPPFEALALSNAYPNLVFLIIEAELLNGTNIEVPESALPTFQFFLQGHLLGQLVTPTLPQLEKILAASNNLVEENPDMSVEASEEEEDEEDEEERYMAQRAAAQQQQQQSSYSLGEAIDQRSQLTAEERRQLFSDINDEEARWAQLLQASPKANRRRGAASASPSPSASEAEDSDGEGVAAPGLVIRGTKITLQPQPQVAQQRRSANPEQNLRDWFDYQRFDDPAESSGVDESNYEGSSDDGRDDDGTAEYEQAAQAYNRARQAIAAHNAQQQQAQAQNQSHKRKVHPPIASSDEDEASVADGGSEDQGYSSAGNSLTASPVIVGRYGPSSPNGRAITSPAAAAGANNAGLVMSPTEAANIERLLLRADPAVQAAFRAFPELDSVTDVFIRLVHLHITNPAEGAAAAGAGARSGAAASQAATDVHVGTKRKVHPDPRPLADEPPRKQKHLELTEAQKRAAQLKEQQAAAALAIARRHKRPNQQVYASASASEEDEPADSEDEAAAGGAGHARTRSELAAQSHLASQQDRYAALQAQYASIQNEIFSKTVHDLHAQTIISDQQLQCLIYLWTQTEQGSDAIRLLIKQYETEGDELEFMYRLVALVKRFEKGQPVGADDMASPSDSEGPNSPRASASEDSEGQDDDDEEEEVDVGSDGGSPLPSDEEQQYRALMRQFASEQGAAQGSSVSGSEPPSTQASPARVPRSSTKAPQSSPAVAAGSASEQSEQTLSFNLALITRLGESQLLSPSESFVAQQYLVHGHPLMQAAFMAFSYNEDIEDLIETVRDVVGAEAQRQEAGAAKAPTAAAAAPKAAAAAASASQYRLTAEDLLEVLPPWLVSAHGPLIEQLVKRNDAAIVGAWNALMVAVQSKRGPELATEVERMIDAVEQRLVQIAEGVEAQQKQQAQAQSSAAAASSSSASKESPLGDASIADALQIASVLHTGRVFDDEETAVLWALILKSDPVIIAAFDLAREDQQWEELHGSQDTHTHTQLKRKRSVHARHLCEIDSHRLLWVFPSL